VDSTPMGQPGLGGFWIDKYLIVVLLSAGRSKHMTPTMQAIGSLVLSLDLLLVKSGRGGCCRRF